MATKRTTKATSPQGEAVRPRSLAEDLRRRTDDQIGALLEARPDLVHPVPADLGSLATRAGTGPSTARALDRLDLFALQVVTALGALPDPSSYADVLASLHGVPGTVL